MGANINSNVFLGTYSDVSVGAQVMLDIHIGAHSMLGAQALARDCREMLNFS